MGCALFSLSEQSITNVPLKPYNPLLISSLSYPDNEAVKVLTTVPSTDKTASCHELKAIPNNINPPDRTKFKEQTGRDPLGLKYPMEDQSWINFR